MTTSSEPPLVATWRGLRQVGRSALIPYLTAGFPDPQTSRAAVRAAEASGADILELGIPFSDPLADGPTIQRASEAALRAGVTARSVLQLLRELELRIPVVLFTYLNPVLAYGVERFLRDAVEAGAAGLLLTDLPAGADPPLERAIRESRLDLIRLVAPTTQPARLAVALDGAGGFVYLISRLGVTGARESLEETLAESVRRVRAVTRLPIAVGFGISTPTQARQAAALADGVVVGSALLDALGRGGVSAVSSLVGALRAALDAPAAAEARA